VFINWHRYKIRTWEVKVIDKTTIHKRSIAWYLGPAHYKNASKGQLLQQLLEQFAVLAFSLLLFFFLILD
jgi:hypothetical protein